jgi:hypothetical protein
MSQLCIQSAQVVILNALFFSKSQFIASAQKRPNNGFQHEFDKTSVTINHNIRS